MPTEETDEGDRNLDRNSEDEGVLGEEEEEGEMRELRGKGIRGECPGYGLPMRCYYKGKYRTIHDGGGLISQGRWPVKSRRPMSGENGIALASTCKQLFMKWLQEVDEGGSEKGVKEIFWSMAGGKTKESPFKGFIEKARAAVDEKLVGMGLNPSRPKGDRASEVNFRRVEAMWRM